MITIAMSTVIGTERTRVWRALADPEEFARWDDRLLGPLDDAVDFPRVGSEVRWRYRLSAIPIILRVYPLEVEPPERLRSSVSLGLVRLDETYTLGVEAGELNRTRLSLRLVAANATAVVGGELDRFAVRRIVAEFADSKLRAVQKWCENSP